MTRFDTTFFDAIENMMLRNIEHLTRPVKNFLPYDVIQRDEDGRIVINVAVSGYSKDNLDVTWNDGMLTVEGKGLPYAEEFKVVYSGLSKRAFKAQFPVSPLYQDFLVKKRIILCQCTLRSLCRYENHLWFNFFSIFGKLFC